MSEPLLEIPYGMADFTAIQELNMTYVDKTRFITELERAGRFLFFLRPRRSGKSLMLSTLAGYYDLNFATDFERWFGGTWIGMRLGHSWANTVKTPGLIRWAVSWNGSAQYSSSMAGNSFTLISRKKAPSATHDSPGRRDAL